MNSIESLQRFWFYTNLTSSARATNAEINLAFNDAINEFVNQQMGDEENRDPKNFEWIQQIRDNLYTLIKTTAPVVTNGTVIVGPYFSTTPSHFPYPTDYDTLISIMTTVSAVTTYARPTTYNKLGPLINDSFRHPTNSKPYYLEDSTGYTIYRGTSGTMTVSFYYIRQAATFSIGSETQYIITGGTLTNAIPYIATEVSAYGGATFQIGATITGTGAALTSGQVIATSNTVPIDLPVKVQERICKMAADKYLISIGELQQGDAIKTEVAKL